VLFLFGLLALLVWLIVGLISGVDHGSLVHILLVVGLFLLLLGAAKGLDVAKRRRKEAGE
jgi:hypothetical protein